MPSVLSGSSGCSMNWTPPMASFLDARSAPGRVVALGARRSPAMVFRGHGFTLIELLVVVAIIMLLAALTMPVLTRATRQARAAHCVSNVKQLAVALRAYANNCGCIYSAMALFALQLNGASIFSPLKLD